jgi:hypothetical protein
MCSTRDRKTDFFDHNAQSAMPGLTKEGTPMKTTSVSYRALAAVFAGMRASESDRTLLSPELALYVTNMVVATSN